MKELAIVSFYEYEAYEYEHDEVLFIMRNIKQARAIYDLFLKIDRFLSGDHKKISCRKLDIEIITDCANTEKAETLYLESSNLNYTRISENYIHDIEDAEQELDKFLKENPDDGNAHIKEVDILNSLTHKDITNLACKIFNITPHEFQGLKKIVRDFKRGSFFNPENKHKYLSEYRDFI